MVLSHRHPKRRRTSRACKRRALLERTAGHGDPSASGPGDVPTVPQYQKSKGSLIMTAALELSQNQMTHLYSPRKDTGEMLRMLRRLIDQYKHKRRIYLSWDAASWHIYQRLRTWAVMILLLPGFPWSIANALSDGVRSCYGARRRAPMVGEIELHSDVSHSDFIRFLNTINRQTPAEQDLVDWLKRTMREKVQDFIIAPLDERPSLSTSKTISP